MTTNDDELLIPRVTVDVRLSIPVEDEGFNEKIVGLLRRLADYLEIAKPAKDHSVVDMGDAGLTSVDCRWEVWDDAMITVQRIGELPVDLSVYPGKNPTLTHVFCPQVQDEEEKERALKRLRRDRRHWKFDQEGYQPGDENKPVADPDPDIVVTPPPATPDDDDKAEYLKGSVRDAWKDINKIARLLHVRRKPIHPKKHPIDSAAPPQTPGELPPGLNKPVEFPDAGGMEGQGVLSVDRTGIAEVIAAQTARTVEDWLSQAQSIKKMYLIECDRNPYDWDMMERTIEFLCTMLDTCNTPIEMDIFAKEERLSFTKMRSKNTRGAMKRTIYPSAVSKMMRHKAPLDLFPFLPGTPGFRPNRRVDNE